MRCIEGISNRVEGYPSFECVDPPSGSNAVRAWKGLLQPFPDSSELGLIVQDLENDLVVDLHIDGAIRHHSVCALMHTPPSYVNRLTGMHVAFEVVVLEFNDGRDRRAYCVRPEISRIIFPTHPHLRDDHRFLLNGRCIDALCPYRSDEVQPPDLPRYLDYVAIFLAKHLVWVRTLELKTYTECGFATAAISPDRNRFHSFPPTTPSIQSWSVAPAWSHNSPNIYEVIREAVENPIPERWEGKWIGTSAPHDIDTTLVTVSAGRRCVCGSGRAYGSCCRPKHKTANLEARTAAYRT